MLKMMLALIGFSLVVLSPIAAQDSSLPELAVITAENAGRLQAIARLGDGSVYDVVWSPDGNTIAAVGSVGIWLYDFNALDVPPRFLLRQSMGYVAAFSPDSQTIVTGDNNGDLIFWDAQSGRLLDSIHAHSQLVKRIAVSPDGRLIASQGGDKKIRLWETSTRRELTEIDNCTPDYLPSFITFSLDGRTLLYSDVMDPYSADADCSETHIRGWDLEEGAERYYIAWDSSPILGLDEDGNLLAVSTHEKDTGYAFTLRRFSIETGGEMSHHDLPFPYFNPSILAFSPTTNRLAFVSVFTESFIGLWDTSANIELPSLQKGPYMAFSKMAFSPDGLTLASIDSNDKLHIWNCETSELLTTFYPPNHSRPVLDVAFSPDGQLLAAGEWRGALRVWNLETQTRFTIREDSWQTATSVAFSPDGKLLAAGGDWTKLQIWDLARNENRFFQGQNDAWVVDSIESSLDFTPDGRTLVLLNDNHTGFILWDVEDDTIRQRIEMSAQTFALNSDGILAVSGYSNPLSFWNLTTDELIDLPFVITGDVHFDTLAFSPDTAMLATSFGTEINIWDFETGRQLTTLMGHQHWLTDFEFSPDSMLLASVDQPPRIDGDEATIRVWDVKTGRQLTLLSEQVGPLTSVSFSPDGKLIASGSWDGTIWLWGIKAGEGVSGQSSLTLLFLIVLMGFLLVAAYVARVSERQGEQTAT